MEKLACELVCNQCGDTIENLSYRTSCNHLFCVCCAQTAFTSGNQCPYCYALLQKNDIVETIIGVKELVDSSDRFFHHILQEGHWQSIIRNHRQMSLDSMNVTEFLFTQLITSITKTLKENSEMKEIIKSLHAQLVKAQADLKKFDLQEQEYRSNLQKSYDSLSEELMNLKEAYREKQRKCLAWEKAYGSLRSQLTMNTSQAKQDKGQAPRLSGKLHDQPEIAHISSRYLNEKNYGYNEGMFPNTLNNIYNFDHENMQPEMQTLRRRREVTTTTTLLPNMLQNRFEEQDPKQQVIKNNVNSNAKQSLFINGIHRPGPSSNFAISDGKKSGQIKGSFFNDMS